MITVNQLIAAGVGPTQANVFAEPLSAACARFDISTPARIAALLGQCMVESVRFVHTEEDLYYTDPLHIAQIFRDEFPTVASAVSYTKNSAKLGARAYASKNGNGDEASGDGYTFRGRGVLQITGREKYADAAIGLARPYVAAPDLVAGPADACLTAAWFWSSHKLNVLADAGAIDEITREVNGRAMLQAQQRRDFTTRALAALNSNA